MKLWQLEELQLNTGPTVPSFLDHLDTYLQVFTLGITEDKPGRPSVTNHKFRKLSDFQVGAGDGTGALSPSQHLTPRRATLQSEISTVADTHLFFCVPLSHKPTHPPSSRLQCQLQTCQC